MTDAPSRIARFGHGKQNGVLTSYIFMCPGCLWPHDVYLKAAGLSVKWDTIYDADKDSLIATPSLLIWHGEKDGQKLRTCHSYIKGTHIEFLADCTNHALRGLVEIPVYDWSKYGGLDDD